ncbi:MAG: hypothetical protein JWL61_4189 [Gemmatimonadetes bacterium]|nr:hypothetical protein [Gemmatimonadota bacterium]
MHATLLVTAKIISSLWQLSLGVALHAYSWYMAHSEHDLAWLREVERRVAAGMSRDSRDILVALRDILPAGFVPSHLDHRLLNGSWPSVRGLLAIGDSAKLVPDVERTMEWIRERLIEYPQLAQVEATGVSDALGFPIERAKVVLRLLTTVGPFVAGASGSDDGYDTITLGREEILAEYLAFDSIDAELAKHSPAAVSRETAPRRLAQERQTIEGAVVRNSVFILMSMDPADASLSDVRDAICETCANFALEACRIDDIEHQDRITDRILENIASAEFIVADLTGERPNVYYEIGYAHAIGKRPILFRKSGTRLHFDLSVHNVPEYRNIGDLRKRLRSRFEAMLGRLGSATEQPG